MLFLSNKGVQFKTVLFSFFFFKEKKKGQKLSYSCYNHTLQNRQLGEWVGPLTCSKALGFSSYEFWL